MMKGDEGPDSWGLRQQCFSRLAESPFPKITQSILQEQASNKNEWNWWKDIEVLFMHIIY